MAVFLFLHPAPQYCDLSHPPNGTKIVMSRTTYRDSLERAEDAAATAAYARTRGEEHVPLELVKRLDAGDHPVRVWREHRAFTPEQLGAKAALSIGYLSEIEAGKKPRSIKAIRAIAGALKLDLDDLTGWLK
ncbi:MAG: helix-turn-helix transcriptional regulator [Proteobacteria bacterium]|nr:helix-turn-helix transcriptional regulator [Pseudomonadota bacterium]